jgi:hypothetical protein
MVKASLWYARKGPEHVYEIIAGNANVTGLDFMERVEWEQLGLRLDVEWEILNGAALFAAVSYQSTSGEERYAPTFMAGEVLNAEAGFRIGW